MRKSLYWKLTLAFILVAFTSAALVAIFIRATSVDRLSRLVIEQQRDRLEQSLASYYQSNHSWAGIEENWRKIQYSSAPTPDYSFTPAVPPDNIRNQDGIRFERDRSLFGLASPDGTVIISFSPDYPTGTMLPSSILSDGKTISVDGQTVGVILTAPERPDFNPAEAMFLERTTQALLLAMLGTFLVAIVVGILLAMNLTRPLRALTSAAHNIAQGKLEQQVPVTSKDEIGQLASAFNSMSQEVARVNQLRRQMTADIAHDLRTPLTVIAGYIESMRDGVLSATPQRLSLIYTEIERLQHLVNDLRMLSQVDAGELSLNPQVVDPMQLLEYSAEIFKHNADRQNVVLATNAPANLPAIFVDEARMMQVMDNLISNSLRYTPPGGRIDLTASEKDGMVEITVKDTGAGILPEEIPFIFDRFRRADKSRHSETGESGLGLAIVKALVEAHKGQVWAESSLDVGTTIFIHLPAYSA